ncbi:RNA-directed DNA polymerase, eukaryota, reverse transcriptase zinc-binding domain protein [Tanacetum coccineum]
MQKVKPRRMHVWVKINNVPLEAWSAKGISALASGLGKPILMDTMIATMCHKGIGSLGYARVLVEMDAAKELKTETEIQYIDKSKNIKGSKKVQVKYDWVPPACTHCKVFGHEKRKCLNGGVVMSGSTTNQTSEKPNDKFNQQSMNQFKDMTEYFKTKWNEIQVNNGNAEQDTSDMDDVFENNEGTAKVMRDNEVCGIEGGIDRGNLWKELVQENRYVNGNPWCISGDLNVTLQPNKHSCGSSVMNTDMMEFQDCLNEIEVEDICRSGLHFTWTKNLQRTKAGNMTGILKKLDIVMSNEEFIKKFPNAHAKFLPYLISDHTPSILCIPTTIKKKAKAFRFANFLTNKQEFIPIVSEIWGKNIHGCHMCQIVKKMKSLKIPLNKLALCKGNLFKRVESLMVQLQKVQTDIDIDPHNPVLRDLEAMLVKEFYEAESDEEKF